jgi:hypothetical protein
MIPVLIVGYKRVEELSTLFRKTLESGVKKVYVALDGIDSEIGSQVTREIESEINKIASNFCDLELKVWVREKNLGSALSVMTAIEWAFQFEEALVILEDDLEISSELFVYFANQLQNISNDSKVLMSSGSNVFRGESKDVLSGHSNYPIVWGWLTTKNKWQVIRNGIFIQELNFEKPLPRTVKIFLETGRIRALSGLIDAWDVPLAAFMKAKGYKSLIPSRNLVSNIGFDRNATHTTSNVWPLGVGLEKLDSDESDYSYCFDKEMEVLVFDIKWWHFFSKLKLRMFAFSKTGDIQKSRMHDRFLTVPIPRSDSHI